MGKFSLSPEQVDALGEYAKDAKVTVTFVAGSNDTPSDSLRVCYEPAWLIDNSDNLSGLDLKRKVGSITTEKSLVTCHACLEWIHA